MSQPRSGETILPPGKPIFSVGVERRFQRRIRILLLIYASAYCRDFEAPAANSRSTPSNPLASLPHNASKSTVAAMCGDSGRKRTFSRLCPRDVISVVTIGGSSCRQWLEVVSTTGRERTTVQLRDRFIWRLPSLSQ